LNVRPSRSDQDLSERRAPPRNSSTRYCLQYLNTAENRVGCFWDISPDLACVMTICRQIRAAKVTPRNQRVSPNRQVEECTFPGLSCPSEGSIIVPKDESSQSHEAIGLLRLRTFCSILLSISSSGKQPSGGSTIFFRGSGT